MKWKIQEECVIFESDVPTFVWCKWVSVSEFLASWPNTETSKYETRVTTPPQNSVDNILLILAYTVHVPMEMCQYAVFNGSMLKLHLSHLCSYIHKNVVLF